MRSPHIIVVGAGPGGSSAALTLARGGAHVHIIDKSDFPREKSCGDGLTRMSVKLLYRAGLLEMIKGAPEIHGVRIFMKQKGARDFEYPGDLEEPRYGMVMPRYQLDNILLQNAIKAGAHFEKGQVKRLLLDERGKVIGVELPCETGEKQIFADAVIIADGASSRLAYQLNLPRTPRNKLGFGLRGYYSGIEGLTELLEIYLPVLDSTQRYVLPSYGWVFPLRDGSANIGVGLIEKRGEDDVAKIMSRFTEQLRTSDKRFANMSMTGRAVGAPMRFDFQAERSFAPGAMLVGDAAGLISPFTGEGIGYAIESGAMAGETCLTMSKSAGQTWMEMSGYGQALGKKFQGYFEAGHESGKRYLLTYGVVRDTFDNERPLFHLLRQATMFPEGVGESFFDRLTCDLTEDVKENKAELRTDMLSVGNGLLDIMRKDWPFMAKAFTPEEITPGIPFRPSLFMLLSGYMFQPDRALLVQLGIALELGILAAICHNSVDAEREKANEDEVANRGNIFSVLVGDFLLSKSFETISSAGAGYLNHFSKFLARSSEGHLLEKQAAYSWEAPIPKYVEMLHEKYAGLFEACMQLGAVSAGASVQQAANCGRFGRHFSAAYHIIEDALSAKRPSNAVSMVARSDLKIGQFNLAQRLELQRGDGVSRNRLLSQIAEKRIESFPVKPENRNEARRIAMTELDLAEVFLNQFPNSAAKNALTSIYRRIQAQAADSRTDPAKQDTRP
ncbi:geranylgeranyl reductase family protein [bacterium]|nr:MAG: geranylgeranyl reductase family protein [bacterium]